jgi:hypothetical protein
MRVLICGGRDFNNYKMLCTVLDELNEKHNFSCVIEGEARGADRLSRAWANSRKIQVEPYPADWKTYWWGAAGPIRNQEMIDKGKPDMVIAFPGNEGTADMLSRSRKLTRILVEKDGSYKYVEPNSGSSA